MEMKGYMCKAQYSRSWVIPMDNSPVLPKSRHTLKMMVSGLFVEFEITANHIYDTLF